MEAAGVDASGRCLVIRGISDYADAHKDDVWQSYAAGQATVLARELLRIIPGATLQGMESGSMAMHLDSLPETSDMALGSGGTPHRLMASEQKQLHWKEHGAEQASVISALDSRSSE